MRLGINEDNWLTVLAILVSGLVIGSLAGVVLFVLSDRSPGSLVLAALVASVLVSVLAAFFRLYYLLERCCAALGIFHWVSGWMTPFVHPPIADAQVAASILLTASILLGFLLVLIAATQMANHLLMLGEKYEWHDPPRKPTRLRPGVLPHSLQRLQQKGAHTFKPEV